MVLSNDGDSMDGTTSLLGETPLSFGLSGRRQTGQKTFTISGMLRSSKGDVEWLEEISHSMSGTVG